MELALASDGDDSAATATGALRAVSRTELALTKYECGEIGNMRMLDVNDDCSTHQLVAYEASSVTLYNVRMLPTIRT